MVRDLRERKGSTQEELGREAGYGSGAGVSISRLESGLVRPGPDRLTGIAEALGLTSEELEAKALRQEAEYGGAAPVAEAKPRGEVRAAADGDTAPPGQRELNARRNLIEQEIEERSKAITDLSEAFNEQHDRARDEFFMRFVEIASRVEGALPPDPAQLEDDDAADAAPDAVAAYRIKSNGNGVVKALAAGTGGAATGAAVGSAAAYGTFLAVASFGTASTGAAISGLSGIAATNATLALLGGGTLAAGGAGVAGGTIVLAGIVVAPMAILFVGGLAWMAKRNRKQRREFAAQLDDAAAELVATRPGIDALREALPRATKTLDYIATHAGHALSRWEDQLGSGTMTWDSLRPADKRRYQDFVDIAAVQVTIATFNFQGLLITRGRDRDELVEFAEKVLTQSQETVQAVV